MISTVLSVVSLVGQVLLVQSESYSWVSLSPPLASNSPDGPGTRTLPTLGLRSLGSNEFQFFVFGGATTGPSGSSQNDLWSFNSRTQTWSRHCEGSNSAPAPRNDAVGDYIAVSGGGYFVISTGQNDVQDFFGDIWVCDLTTNQWREADAGSAIRPEVRYGSAGGFIGSTFYITHGFSSIRYSNSFAFDIAAYVNEPARPHSWTEIIDGVDLFNPFAPHARCVVGSATTGSSLYMYGGCANKGETGGPCPAQDFWKLDVTKNEWERLADGPVPVILGKSAFMRDRNQMVLYGGNSDLKQVITQKPSRLASDLHIYDVVQDSWTSRVASIPPSWDAGAPIFMHTMVEMGDSDVLMGEGRFVEMMMFGGNQNFSGQIFGLVSDVRGVTSTREGWYYFSMVYLHGIFMFVGWGVFLQFGAFAFRYFKHHESKWAWMAHRGAQSFGLLCAIVGFILSFYTDGDFKFSHARIGIAVMVMGVLNPLIALFRCHPGQSKNLLGCGFNKRWIFNLVHHLLGRAALVLALINIALGLSMAQAPIGWWIAFIVWIGVIVLAYATCELLRVVGKLPRISRTKEEQYMWGFGDAKDPKKTDEFETVHAETNETEAA